MPLAAAPANQAAAPQSAARRFDDYLADNNLVKPLPAGCVRETITLERAAAGMLDVSDAEKLPGGGDEGEDLFVFYSQYTHASGTLIKDHW